MEAAKSLLVETDDTVEGIGTIVRYKDDKYFMKVFKRYSRVGHKNNRWVLLTQWSLPDRFRGRRS